MCDDSRMTSTSLPQDRIQVDVRLPLPLDVVATIGNLIEAAYPSTVIDLTGEKGFLRLLLPAGRRGNRPVGRKRVAAAVVPQVDEPMEVTGWGVAEGGFAELSLSAPQELAAMLLPLVKGTLDASGDAAVNYVEQEIVDRSEPGRRYVVIAARSAAQTPHALRRQAEVQRDSALAMLDEMIAAAESGTDPMELARGFAVQRAVLADQIAGLG